MKKSTLFLIGFLLVLIGGGLTYRYFARDTDSRGATKLMRAIQSNEELKTTSKLIAKSEDINVQDKKGQTALIYAVRHSQESNLIRNLLVAGANVKIADNQGNTPLLIASKNNPSAEITQLLILYGADVNAFGPDGQTPLALAARHNTGAVIEVLLRANADLEIPGVRVEDLITNNLKLSEQERSTYRQLLLLLSILEARANAKALATAGTEILPAPQEEVLSIPEPSEVENFEGDTSEDISIPTEDSPLENEYFCDNCESPAE